MLVSASALILDPKIEAAARAGLLHAPVCFTTPFTLHEYVRVSGSPSASWGLAVATSTSFDRGVASLSDTVTVCPEFTTVAVAEAGGSY